MQMPPLENVRWQCLGIRAPRRAGPVAAGSRAANHNPAADRKAHSLALRRILPTLVVGLGLALSIGFARAAWDPVERSISDLEAAYTAGSTSVVEVVQTYLARIAQFDQPSTSTSMYPLNSVAQINPLALADAARIDSLRAQGATTSQYPLLGVPVIVKDSFDVAGLPTRVGLSILDGANTPGGTTLTALDDAASVARLRDAGAIILGKATMSSLAWSTGGIDNAFGLVRNPYNLNRLPGGSSSGSAVSVDQSLQQHPPLSDRRPGEHMPHRLHLWPDADSARGKGAGGAENDDGRRRGQRLRSGGNRQRRHRVTILCCDRCPAVSGGHGHRG